MKKFKNNICVDGSSALVTAFAKECKLLGRTVTWDGIPPYNSFTTYDQKGVVRAHGFTTGRKARLGQTDTQYFDLPKDWDKALALASEVVEPKSEFAVGQWVVHTKTSDIYKIEEIDRDGWCNNKQTPGGGWNANQLRLATDEEIKQQLIKIARDKGFVDGITFKGCNGAYKDVLIKIGIDYQINAMVGGVNEGVFCGDSWIYHKGKWGTIVKETKPITYKTGQRFEDEDTSCEYILAHCGDLRVALINLKDGNLYSDKIKVKSLREITKNEFKKICNGDDFKLIK